MTTILSWNVNGLRAVTRNGFLDWFMTAQPDVLCLQETRLLPEELPKALQEIPGYEWHWNPAQKKGYSGTATLTKKAPLSVETLGIDEIDAEGRLQVVHFPEFVLLNGYWPNSQSERARLPYKLTYCDKVTEHANALVKAGHNVILCGDFNIAHTEIDLARPKQNENNAGYYIEEREAMTQFLSAGYIDTFRHFNKEPDNYTWWSYRTRGRARNVGWRLDYHCVNEAFLPRVKRAWILSDVMGSDHCPVGLEIA